MAGDLLLYNGCIRTLDPLAPLVEALLIRQGRIVARGTSAEMLACAAGCRRLDLGGHTAIPGLEDAHLHLCTHGLALSRLRLQRCLSLQEALEVVRAAVSGAGPRWMRGSGWDHNTWPVPRHPSASDLDTVAPDRPVALDSKDLHSLWVNSAALRAAGIEGTTPDPPGGRIWRDTRGQPTGILSESARELVERVIPSPSPDERLSAARLAVTDAARLGLTSVHSCEAPDSFAALADLEREGQLNLRVWHMVPVRFLDQALALGLYTGFGCDRLRIGHVKMFADGALGSGTAEMLQPYEDDPTAYGVPTTTTEELYRSVMRAAQGGLASAIHAIGDAANRRVLDVYERVAKEGTGHGLRQRIEHAQLVAPEDQPRFAALGVIASMQPIHCTQDRDMAERRWGSRSSFAYPWRSLARHGARLAFGTDAPVEQLDPLPGLYAAVTRRRANETGGEIWHPEQSLTLNQALLAYTWGGAWAAGAERERGTLTPGKFGDVTVFSRRLPDEEPESLLETCIDYTILDGQITYER